MSEAEKEYYRALDKWANVVNGVISQETLIRQEAAKRAEKIVSMINAGEQFDEPDRNGGLYD
jgi:hypothetical protein